MKSHTSGWVWGSTMVSFSIVLTSSKPPMSSQLTSGVGTTVNGNNPWPDTVRDPKAY